MAALCAWRRGYCGAAWLPLDRSVGENPGRADDRGNRGAQRVRYQRDRSQGAGRVSAE